MKQALHFITRTAPGFAPIVLRLTLAVVFFPHGAQKVLGWFGGYGWDGTLGFFTGKLGIPWILAVAAILTEFLAPFALVAGLFTRVAAFALAVDMAVAALTVHVHNGFFANWSGQQAGEGIEYHLLAIGAALALVVAGAGCASLDRVIAAKTAAE